MNLDDPVNQKIRERIRNIRQRKKLSIRKAALLSEIPESSYSCMENGFYRISLLNLKKILDGLDVGIAEVWPDSTVVEERRQPVLAGRTVLPARRFFRFQEVFRLSDAKRAALLEGDVRRLQLIDSINLTRREKRLFLGYFPERLHPSWSVFQKQNEEHRCCLCLQDARVEDYLKRLIDIYLDLWFAEGFAEP